MTTVISTREKKIQEALLLPAGWRILYSRCGLRMYSKGRDGDEGACVYVCVWGSGTHRTGPEQEEKLKHSKCQRNLCVEKSGWWLPRSVGRDWIMGVDYVLFLDSVLGTHGFLFCVNSSSCTGMVHAFVHKHVTPVLLY